MQMASSPPQLPYESANRIVGWLTDSLMKLHIIEPIIRAALTAIDETGQSPAMEAHLHNWHAAHK